MSEEEKKDSIFDEDDFFTGGKTSDAKEKTSPPVEEKLGAESPLPLIADTDKSLPQLCGSDYPNFYIEMINRVHAQYKELPPLNYDKIYAELAELTIKCHMGGSFQVLNSEIQRVQGAKDRFSEIFLDVCRNYFIKKRVVDVVRDSWGKFTDEKNAEKRKGDCSFRLSNFEIDFAKVEALFRVMTHIYRNLDSLHEALSRRITIYQSLLKMNDVGKDGLPDFDFDKGVKDPFAHEDDISENNTNFDPAENQKPKPENF